MELFVYVEMHKQTAFLRMAGMSYEFTVLKKVGRQHKVPYYPIRNLLRLLLKKILCSVEG
jgi:hypothetical protein